MNIRFLDNFRFWEKYFIEKCQLDFKTYFNRKIFFRENILTRDVLEKHLYGILSDLERQKFNKIHLEMDLYIAYQILAILIMETGATLPSQVKQDVLKSTKWEIDQKFGWPSDKVLLRKSYLTNFRRKINKFERGDRKKFLHFKVDNDIELGQSIIGIEDLAKNRHFHEITFINLDDSDLTLLPTKLLNFKNLKSLSLSYNSLSSSLSELKNLKLLSTLWLDSNDSYLVPESIYLLSNLKKLDLSFNSIKAISDKVINLRYLEDFSINNNKITELPLSISKLKSLRILNVSFNSLLSFPDNIGELSNLEWFLFSNNKLEDLPNSFKNLENLEHISTENNLFSYPNTFWPKKISNKLRRTKEFNSNFEEHYKLRT